MSARHHEAALAALAAGISVVPPRIDGSKAPMYEWKEYQERLPFEAEIDGWYEDPYCTGIGAVTGAAFIVGLGAALVMLVVTRGK